METVEQVASHLSGAAGPDGVDGVDLRNWLLRFGKESEALREEMAAWSEWSANCHPPWAAYRALMAGRLVALDKSPGVRPVGIGSIFWRLFAKCLIKVIGHEATSACGNVNLLCAGLPAEIEGLFTLSGSRLMGVLRGAAIASSRHNNSYRNGWCQGNSSSSRHKSCSGSTSRGITAS